MCSKPRNEDKDNIDRDIEVCAIGVQTIMQSDHGTRNQNKLKIQSYHDAFCSEFPKCDQSGAKQYMASPDFFRLLLTQFLKMAFITAMIIAFLISNPQFSIWNISYISLFYSSWMFIQIDINECTREYVTKPHVPIYSRMSLSQNTSFTLL